MIIFVKKLIFLLIKFVDELLQNPHYSIHIQFIAYQF